MPAKRVDLPADLEAFLAARRQLEYDPATCEAGLVRLLPRSRMRLRAFETCCFDTPHERGDPHKGEAGCYQVPGVDLIGSCNDDYDPEGLLVWFPEEGRYGVWDSSHDKILVFGPKVTWSKIVESPAKYINAQWGFDGLKRARESYLRPWPRYPFGR